MSNTGPVVGKVDEFRISTVKKHLACGQVQAFHFCARGHEDALATGDTGCDGTIVVCAGALSVVVTQGEFVDSATRIRAKASRVVQGHNMPRADFPGPPALHVLFRQGSSLAYEFISSFHLPIVYGGARAHGSVVTSRYQWASPAPGRYQLLLNLPRSVELSHVAGLH